MRNAILWLRVAFSLFLLALMLFSAINHQTIIYLLHQAKGQAKILLNTQPVTEYKMGKKLSKQELENLILVEQVKSYSTDSLGFKPTKNYTTVLNSENSELLWVITASQPFSLKAYEWEFPLVGRVNYKGYFNRALAEAEYNHLVCLGYDVDMRGVSAWSTLGWFSDPILPGMLTRSKGSLCNLLFHELFHSTVFRPGQVDLNENLAGFIAHKATLQFLQHDTVALNNYLKTHSYNTRYSNFMLRMANQLELFYLQIDQQSHKQILKHKKLLEICDSLKLITGLDSARYMARRAFLLKAKNAAFIDLRQYDGLQDSLDKVFNIFYKGNLKKLVQDLKLNRIYY